MVFRFGKTLVRGSAQQRSIASNESHSSVTALKGGEVEMVLTDMDSCFLFRLLRVLRSGNLAVNPDSMSAVGIDQLEGQGLKFDLVESIVWQLCPAPAHPHAGQ